MKRILYVIIILLAFVLPVGAQNTTAQGVTFIEGKTFDELLALGKAENKLVFIDCYTSWCGPCKMMASKVFPTKEVGDYMNPKFVCAKIDMEKGEGPALLDRYDVNAFPTFLVLDHDGKMLHRLVGGSGALEFIAKLDKEMQGGGVNAYIKRFHEGERDSQFISDYINQLELAYMKGELKYMAKELTKAKTAGEIVADSILYTVFVEYLGNPKEEVFQQVYGMRDQVKAKYGERAVSKLNRVWESYPNNFLDFDGKKFKSFNASKMEEYKQLMAKCGVDGWQRMASSMEASVAVYTKEYSKMMSFCHEMSRDEQVDDSRLHYYLGLLEDGITDTKKRKDLKGIVLGRIKVLSRKDDSADHKFQDGKGNEKTYTRYFLDEYNELLKKLSK